jgi:hypothetical protein
MLMTTTAKQTGRDVRARIAEDAAEFYEGSIRGFFGEALSAEKGVWVTCGKCKHKIEVAVPDWGSRTRALSVLLDQGFGRPQQLQDEQNITLVVQRFWRPTEGEDELATWHPDEATTMRLAELGFTPPEDWEPLRRHRDYDDEPPPFDFEDAA